MCAHPNMSLTLLFRFRNCRKVIPIKKILLCDRQYCTQNVWKGVVGLEIHAQIDTVSKLFSGAATSFIGRVNNNVSLFDAAIPGTLPVLNKGCVESGVLTALALDCKVNPVSLFDRKHYFYADLPAGYQITQQRKPLANDGALQFEVYQESKTVPAYKKTSKIRQIQLEQDSGKSIHDEIDQRSLVDLNRAGIPLMEIIFEPDLEDGEEAAALVQELILIFSLLGTCNCKMEEGSLRVDANVSVHRPGSPLGVRSEVKNIGSLRAVAKAVNYEIQRQILLLESGNSVVNETRSWCSVTNKTLAMRDKEEKQDYRFMPEPNLPPLHVDLSDTGRNNKNILAAKNLKKYIPELPNQTRDRLRSSYNLTDQTVHRIVNERRVQLMFERILQGNSMRSPKQVANIITIEVLSLINKEIISLSDCDERFADKLGEIIDLLQQDEINLFYLRKLIEEIVGGNDQSPAIIVKEKGWKQVTDMEEIQKICEDCISRNPDLVKLWKKGKPKAQEKATRGFNNYIVSTTDNKTHMKSVNKVLKELLSKI